MNKVLITYEMITAQRIIKKQTDCLVRDIELVVNHLKSIHCKILSVSKM